MNELEKLETNLKNRHNLSVYEVIVALSIVILVIFLLVPHAEADEPTELTFGGVSYHLASDDTTTWFHNALLLESNRFMGGYVTNSYGQDSWVVSYKVWESYHPKYTEKFYLGAVKGYDKCYDKFSKDEKGKEKVAACFLPVYTITFNTSTRIKPQVSLWGDAVVLTGQYTFR